MKNYSKFLNILFITIMISGFYFTIHAHADNTTSKDAPLDYSGLVKCDGATSKNEPDRNNPCNFLALMSMVKSIINWAFAMTAPIMVGLLAYGGILHMTGREDKIKQSYKIIKSALWGFIIMLSAWFIVTTILNMVIDNAYKEVVKTFVNFN